MHVYIIKVLVFFKKHTNANINSGMQTINTLYP